jgi:hypothetical protein
MGRFGAAYRILTPGSTPLNTRLAAVLALSLGLPNLLSGQVNETVSRDTIIYGVSAPRWAGHLTTVSANVMLGALTAGLLQELRGGSFKDGFTRGALGGVFTYTGKRIASQRFDGAGLMGREVAAIGSSVIRNASEAKPTFERLMFPIGPLRLQVTPRTRQLDASLDVLGAAWIVWGIAESELDLKLSESLSTGTAVFRTNNKLIVHKSARLHGGGFTPASLILLSHVPAWGSVFLDRVAAHERIHVLQEDQLLHTWLDPGEAWLLDKLPFGKRITRRLDFNWSGELLGMLSLLFDGYKDRPWELEAIYFSR